MGVSRFLRCLAPLTAANCRCAGGGGVGSPPGTGRTGTGTRTRRTRGGGAAGKVGWLPCRGGLRGSAPSRSPWKGLVGRGARACPAPSRAGSREWLLGQTPRSRPGPSPGPAGGERLCEAEPGGEVNRPGRWRGDRGRVPLAALPQLAVGALGPSEVGGGYGPAADLILVSGCVAKSRTGAWFCTVWGGFGCG